MWQRILYLHTTKCILYVCIDIFFHSYFNFKFKICLTYHERLKLNYLQQKVWKREYERSSFNGRKLRLTDNQYPQLTLIWLRQEINFLVFFKKTYIWCKISIQFEIYLKLTWDDHKSTKGFNFVNISVFIQLSNSFQNGKINVYEFESPRLYFTRTAFFAPSFGINFNLIKFLIVLDFFWFILFEIFSLGFQWRKGLLFACNYICLYGIPW